MYAFASHVLLLADLHHRFSSFALLSTAVPRAVGGCGGVLAGEERMHR
jgi:hypothetical protein